MLPQSAFMDVSGTASRMPMRMSSTQFLLLDSADRNQLLVNVAGQRSQPWNNFSFQKPQALLDAFADHVLVPEIVFPWFIPNISSLNNTIYTTGGQPITIPVGFYQPAELVTALNAAFAAAGVNALFSYDDVNMVYTFTNALTALAPGLEFANPTTLPFPNFYTTASLFKTLGFALPQSGVTLLPGDALIGNPTLSQYTAYIDIISNRLMRYTSVKDGESASNAQSAVIARVYATDETSTPFIGQGIPQTCRPFTIHRQFKTPKSIQWNKDSFVDYMDIQVVDQWNNLVPLPRIEVGNLGFIDGSYPDFQISLLCSED